MSQKTILVFGGSVLQQSLIENCRGAGLFTVVIDPDPNADAKHIADAFEVVQGDDLEGTCNIVEKYNVKGIITASTDKPLVMMAEIAQKYSFPFISVETAKQCTDKAKMKEVFYANEIPCAKGFAIKSCPDNTDFPVVVKPRDNSGSRGVKLCYNKSELATAISKAIQFSKMSTVMVEEFLEGKEYSVEALHFNEQTHVLQITEKHTGSLPYFVEAAHIQPSGLADKVEHEIISLVESLAKAFQFNHCASHTELKISGEELKIIETSPRLGGDFISSRLVPLSTGINMESALIEIAMGGIPDLIRKLDKSSGIFYFDANSKPEVSVLPNDGSVDTLYCIEANSEIQEKMVQSSLDRYGYIILNSDTRNSLFDLKKKIFRNFTN